MKDFFERYQKISTDAIAELRRLDARDNEMHRSYLEGLHKGELTELGYRSLCKSLEDNRAKKVKEITSKLDEVRREYEAYVDAYTAPSATKMVSEDVELLKNFELSSSEFERMAAKYETNPTMCRLLDSYRKEHSVYTNWRYQTPEQRKEIFSNMCVGVESVIRISDKYDENREGHVALLVSKAYHKMQGSSPDCLKIEAESSAQTGVEEIRNSGTTLF